MTDKPSLLSDPRMERYALYSQLEPATASQSELDALPN